MNTTNIEWPEDLVAEQVRRNAKRYADARAARKLARAQSRPKARSGFVYVIRCEQFCKIGVSKDGKRTWSTDNPFDIEVIRMFPSENMRVAERALHRKYEQYRHRGEWFRLPEPEVEWLKSLDGVDTLLDSMWAEL